MCSRRSAVLLKNDNGALPLIALPGVLSKLAVIGRMATSAAVRYQGAGSAAVNAHQLQEPLELIRAHLASGWGGSASSTLLATVAYADGYGEPCVDDPAAIELAVQAAKGADAAVVFVGLPSTYEVEGRDRAHMRMPSQMNALVGAVAEANPRTIVVLLGGSSMELSTCDKAVAILWMGLAGQAIGGSIVDVLFGATSPTGRLAETWPMQLDDVPCQANFGRNASIRQVVYREALNVGYRYFCSAKVPVRYPFGHGLTDMQVLTTAPLPLPTGTLSVWSRPHLRELSVFRAAPFARKHRHVRERDCPAQAEQYGGSNSTCAIASAP